MSAETSDSKDAGKKRTSSSAAGVMSVADLKTEGIELKLSPDTQKLNWKINTSPTNVDNPDALKKMLSTPPIKKIDLVFPTGITVTARNLKGVTIKDTLDAIYKHYKKRADDELEEPYLAGFEWDKDESWESLKVHVSKTGGPPSKKKKKGEDD